jgi:hypothetical protein
MPTPDAKEHWEEHYVERDGVWSGRVNARLSVDLGEGFGEVGWWGLGGGECVLAGLDGDGAVAPR